MSIKLNSVYVHFQVVVEDIIGSGLVRQVFACIRSCPKLHHAFYTLVQVNLKGFHVVTQETDSIIILGGVQLQTQSKSVVLRYKIKNFNIHQKHIL